MKKFLLMAMAALVAMSASAQKKNFKFDATKHLSIEKVMQKAGESVKMGTAASRMKKAPTADELGTTDYMQVGTGDVYECTKALVTPEKYTITEEWDDPETGEHKTYTYECNVKLQLNFIEGTQIGDFYWATAYGYYDEEAATITVPVQYMVDPTESYGKLVLFGIEGEDYSGEDIVFNVEDNGAMFLSSHEAIYIVIGEGDYQGYYVAYSNETSLIPMNATMQCIEYSSRTSKKWAQVEYGVAVDDQETSISVFGFCGWGAASIDVNEDGSVSIATGQPQYDFRLDDEEFAIYGYASLYAAAIDDQGYVQMDFDREAIVGELEGNTIYITDPAAESVFWLCSKTDSQGAYYMLGAFQQCTITLNNGGFIAGVDGPTLEERIKNTKTYNIMGQQVNRDTYKGVMIRDGKKYFKK